VTSLIVEHFGVPSSPRDARALELTGRRATAELAGRTVWCACALPRARELAAALRDRLEWAGDEGVSAGRMEVHGDEPLPELAQRLDEMLRGRPPGGSELGPVDGEIYAEGARNGESLLGDGVRPDDVVVVHDPLTAALAEAIRARGAHAVWHVTIRGGRAADAARAFMRRHTGPIDAYVMTWRRPVGRGLVEESMTAVMPSADVVAARELGAEYPTDEGHRSRTEEVGWSALLADVINGDRHQTVGGTRHARPSVAPR
jgi:trehalose synthase